MPVNARVSRPSICATRPFGFSSGFFPIAVSFRGDAGSRKPMPGLRGEKSSTSSTSLARDDDDNEQQHRRGNAAAYPQDPGIKTIVLWGYFLALRLLPFLRRRLLLEPRVALARNEVLRQRGGDGVELGAGKVADAEAELERVVEGSAAFLERLAGFDVGEEGHLGLVAVFGAEGEGAGLG